MGVELTADTERAIGWLEDMQMRHFVGAESRFLLIVQMLRDIVQNSVDDPEERLKQLEQQRVELDRQIDQIYETADELKSLLMQVAALPELRSALGEDYLLTRLPGYLVAAGEKVVHSNARLAEQLRRLLDEQTQAENRRVQELIQDIKQAAYVLNLRIPDNMAFLELESAPEIQLVMERTFWELSKSPTFDTQPDSISEEDLDDFDLASLYDQFSIDEEELERHIETLLEGKPQIRLSEVLEHYPVEKGLAEVLAYCVLAARDPRHSIDPDVSEEIVFASLTGTGRP
jgi:Protein of unknown function (DUF3375)